MVKAAGRPARGSALDGDEGGEPASKSARTRQRVLDAAAHCFRRDGFASVTLKDIAARAGIQAGSLYYHFDSKEEIVAAVLATGVDTAMAATREAIAALGPGSDALARLRVAIAAHLRVVLTESSYASANLRILGQVPDAIRARHLRRQREYGGFWRSLFRAAADAGLVRTDIDLSVVRMLTLGALNWSVEWYHADGRSPDEIAALATTLVLDGIATRPSARRARRRRPLRSRRSSA